MAKGIQYIKTTQMINVNDKTNDKNDKILKPYFDPSVKFLRTYDMYIICAKKFSRRVDFKRQLPGLPLFLVGRRTIHS